MKLFGSPRKFGAKNTNAANTIRNTQMPTLSLIV